MKKIRITNPKSTLCGMTYKVEREDAAKYYIRIMGTLMPIFKEDAEELK